MKYLLLLSVILWVAPAYSKTDDILKALPMSLDSLGPTVQKLIRDDNRVIHYIDDGEPDWLPVVLTGGLGTSVRYLRLLDSLRTMRETLKVRIITVERNGFGQTNFNPDLTMADYSADVELVLEHLGVKQFAVYGISGGGPYTAKIATRNADRLLSVHLAATAPSLGQTSSCGIASPANIYKEMLKVPMQFFAFPDSSAMHRVDGFQDTAFDEAARAHFIRGQMADATPLLHEIALYCSEGAIDTTNIKVPVYIYHGLADKVLPPTKTDTWRKAYPLAKLTLREYQNGGHDVQYRHFDQVLLDITGHGNRVLICKDGNHQLVGEDSVSDNAIGLCAWQE